MSNQLHYDVLKALKDDTTVFNHSAHKVRPNRFCQSLLYILWNPQMLPPTNLLSCSTFIIS